MASIAIDVFWQFGCQRPLSRRRIERILCNIRNAGRDTCDAHAVLRKKNGQHKREGARIVPDKRTDIEQQLDEMAADEDEPLALFIGYSQNTYQHEELRLREEEEIIHRTAIAHGLRESLRAARLVGCPSYFEEQVSALETDPEIGDLTTACLIEDCERKAFGGLAA